MKMSMQEALRRFHLEHPQKMLVFSAWRGGNFGIYADRGKKEKRKWKE